MTHTRDEIQATVVGIVADALDQPAAAVKPYSSLIDDLGAESIDFLDIVFRLEAAYGIQISGEEIWAGAFKRKDIDQAAIEDIVATLRERMPDFRWDRYPAQITRKDLPRLITVNTILDYLERRLAAETPAHG